MRISDWSSDVCSSDLLSEDEGGAAHPVAQRAAGTMRQRELAVGHLDLATGLAAQLADRLDDLGHAAPVGGVVVAQAAAVGVERQPAVGCPQALVGDERAALRSEEHTSELQSPMPLSYSVFCLTKKK